MPSSRQTSSQSSSSMEETSYHPGHSSSQNHEHSLGHGHGHSESGQLTPSASTQSAGSYFNFGTPRPPANAALSIRSHNSYNGNGESPYVPTRPRPTHAATGSTDWIRTPVCEHCGSLTPRSGVTTVYGTPIKSRQSFMDSAAQVSANSI